MTSFSKKPVHFQKPRPFIENPYIFKNPVLLSKTRTFSKTPGFQKLRSFIKTPGFSKMWGINTIVQGRVLASPSLLQPVVYQSVCRSQVFLRLEFPLITFKRVLMNNGLEEVVIKGNYSLRNTSLGYLF